MTLDDLPTDLGDVAGEGSAGGRPRRWLSAIARRECGEAGEQAHAEVFQGASAVTLKGEDVLAGLEDRLDPLTGRREVGAAAALVFALRAHDARVEPREFGLDVLASEVLIADQDEDLPGLALAARDELQAHELLVNLRGGRPPAPWGCHPRRRWRAA